MERIETFVAKEVEAHFFKGRANLFSTCPFCGLRPLALNRLGAILSKRDYWVHSLFIREGPFFVTKKYIRHRARRCKLTFIAYDALDGNIVKKYMAP